MSLEDRGAQHDKVAVDKFSDPIVTYEMTTLDYVMRPAANGISGPIVITLPPVAQAKGRFYSICARNADAVNTITIEDNNDDSECWLGNIIFNGKCDRVLMYSDGLMWYALGEAAAWPGVATTPAPGTTPTPTTTAPTTVAAQTTAAPTTAGATTAP